MREPFKRSIRVSCTERDTEQEEGDVVRWGRKINDEVIVTRVK